LQRLWNSQEQLSVALYQAEESYNKCGGGEHLLSQKVKDHCSEFNSPTTLG